MKVSYNWLKQYVDLSSVNANELADLVTLTGIEVDGLEGDGEGIENLVVGYVQSCEAMEGSDHLNITQVDVGADDLVQIVCGAPNVKEGQKVIVALPGAVLPGDFEIKQTELLGTASNGMICSLDELGFSENVIPKFAEDGIYVLSDEAEIGRDASKYIGLDDTIIEFDVTPNRADALSMRGVAHEVGAILDQTPTFEDVSVSENNESIEDYVKVGVDSGEDTPFYSTRIVKDVTVTESPIWMQRRLMAAGIRPIDSIVDITNYIMLEYGQPLHAFDFDAVGTNELYVRRATEGEKMVTLDGKERTLTNENLVVTNGTDPVALAGVMGGLNTHITDETKTIAIESAIFNPVLVRKTAQKLNLRSEASSRNEKGINKATVVEALDKAAYLMAKIGGGTTVEGVQSVSALDESNPVVSVTLTEIERLVGLEFSAEEISKIFDRLGFPYDIDGERFDVEIPPRRWDISISADLVEEVARIHGYNNIPSTLPTTESIPGELNEVQRVKRHVQDFLQSVGFNQSVSYALTTPEKASRFTTRSMAGRESVTLEHPMSQDHQTLRQSIVTGLLDVAQYNKARQINNIQLFEIGAVFSKENNNQYHETPHVGGLLNGQLTEDSWSEKAVKIDFYTAKGVIEQLLSLLGVASKVTYRPMSEIEEMHPGRTAEIYAGEHYLGYVGQVHPTVASEYDLTEVYVYELDFMALIEETKLTKEYQTIPKYPGTSRDMALLVDTTITHQEILDIIESESTELLKSVHLFDLYDGKNIEEGKQSLAYSLFYQNPESTLKDEEVDKEFEKVKEALKTNVGAIIR